MSSSPARVHRFFAGPASGFDELQRESITVATDAGPSGVETERVVWAMVQIRKPGELESGVQRSEEHSLNSSHYS